MQISHDHSLVTQQKALNLLITPQTSSSTDTDCVHALNAAVFANKLVLLEMTSVVIRDANSHPCRNILGRPRVCGLKSRACRLNWFDLSCGWTLVTPHGSADRTVVQRDPHDFWQKSHNNRKWASQPEWKMLIVRTPWLTIQSYPPVNITSHSTQSFCLFAQHY